VADHRHLFRDPSDVEANPQPVYFDQRATTYGDRNIGSDNSCLKTVLLNRYARPTDWCLDIGSANGIHMIPLASRVERVYGVDLSAAMVAELEKRIKERGFTNVELAVADASRLHFDDSYFDLVYCFSTLFFVSDVDACLREMVRILKPKGIAIIDITGRRNLSSRHWTKYYRSTGYQKLNSFSLGIARTMLTNVGMEILECHATGILDQWKYLPLIWRCTFLDHLFHSQNETSSLDYRLSQRFPEWANRWYFVLQKG
jgi:ubiquinone/menaquinone biosynthesis C-methylase UbiE